MDTLGLARWEFAIYSKGAEARQCNKSKRSCPYSFDNLHRRCLWLAGWNDTDIALAPEKEDTNRGDE